MISESQNTSIDGDVQHFDFMKVVDYDEFKTILCSIECYDL